MTAPAVERPQDLDRAHGSALAVSTAGLTKRFRSGQVAVDGLDLAVPTGSVYGFLGPNGSGKTTTIRMLLGLARPTAGTARLLGGRMPEDAARVLPRVGALVEGPAFYPHLSGRENLRRIDAVDRTADPTTSAERIAAALDRVGLTAAGRKKYRAYSLGMRQRLGLAAALLRPRDLLVLDEPTNGLDPQGTREVRTLIAELASGGTTVMLSTHLLAEVEQICTHVGVMNVGRLVAQAPLDELRAGTAPRVEVESDRPLDAVDTLRRVGLTDIELDGNRARAVYHDIPADRVVAALVYDGVPVQGFRVLSPTLEEVFVGLTGEGFDVSA
ncbi:ATP-binding cassette domain-containing protein [Cryptosporangium sp. NPDC051539]|uniref:ABC transporter ATP-binding protein n=1 Tax=Cryptosporangium sp. NPDC051539 TaxID=3363962 RepID=UPI0037B5187A